MSRSSTLEAEEDDEGAAKESLGGWIECQEDLVGCEERKEQQQSASRRQQQKEAILNDEIFLPFFHIPSRCLLSSASNRQERSRRSSVEPSHLAVVPQDTPLHRHRPALPLLRSDPFHSFFVLHQPTMSD